MDNSLKSFVRLEVSDLKAMPQLDNLPVLLCGITDDEAANAAKYYLLQFFSANTPVFFGKGFLEKTTLNLLEKASVYGDIDSENSDVIGGSAFIIPKGGFDKSVYTFGDLLRIMQVLTGENGCPWDKEQTHKSIRSNMIEEAYEAALAIDSGDTENLIEELGDVLLQSVFHAEIAEREDEFNITDVLSVLCRKLYARHTHIFGDKSAKDGDEALKNWEDAKSAEKAGQGQAADKEIKSYMGLPSLLRAQKIYKKLAKTEDTKAASGITAEGQIKITVDKNTDFGKLFFDFAAECSRLNIDAETELNAYLNKIIRESKGFQRF